jgi:hypothetical protein
MGRQRLADQPGQFGIVEGLPPVAGQGHGVRLRGQTGTLGAEEGAPACSGPGKAQPARMASRAAAATRPERAAP